MIAESIKNGSSPIQPFPDLQASILDLVLFSGFTRMSTAVQGYLTVDLSVYAPLLCFFGLLVFSWGCICKYLLGLLETYYTSIIHLRYREDAYDMLMLWISSQSFAKNARSSLVTTNLVSSLNHIRNDFVNGRDAKKRTLYYTPWNGRFFMWYHGHLLMFRRYQAGEFNNREEISISCFGRSPQILQKVLSECSTEYSKLVQDKTALYRHQDGTWARSTLSNIRPISTVVLGEGIKDELLKDIGDFLSQPSRQWYSDRGIPYRRGYLLYGTPGTGKSSLSLSLAGYCGLDIYILNLSAINEATLESLFAKLPSHCVILLEDIDAVTSSRSKDAETKDYQIATSSLSQENKPASGNLSLSGLLNVLDGVGSQQGRVLIMTTNHITHLDEALIRPGRVDRKFEIGLANKKMTVDLFCIFFKPAKNAFALSKNILSDAEDGTDAASNQKKEEVKRVERLAEEFASRVPELKFSPAEISSFLLKYRQSPEEAINNVEQLTSKHIEAESKQPTSKNSKSEDAQPKMAQNYKWGTPLDLRQSTTPQNSPVLLPSTNAHELIKSVRGMQMPSSHPRRCTCSHTPPEDPSEATLTDLSSRTLSYTTNEPTQIATTKHVQQRFDIILSLDAKQEPPPPAATDEFEIKKPKARASTLEFKKINEVWDKTEYKYKVVESLTPPDDVRELDQYIFVVRTRIDKDTKNRMHFIDVKSAGLRDVLQKVLKDVKGVWLHEEKPSVEQNLLYHYISDLEELRQNTSETLDRSTLEHLDLLQKFIKRTYASTTESLDSLLEKHQITYDLLWTLFKPNTLTYTTCCGTNQPRCVRYEVGEEKKAIDGVKSFHIKAHYLDYDGKVFGQASSEHSIEKFRGAKRITTLEAFPLQYHQNERSVRDQLAKCGRGFLSMLKIHHCQYQGTAFYIEKQKVVRTFVKSRVVVDAAYFREENPNYNRPSIENPEEDWVSDDEEECSTPLIKSDGLSPLDVDGEDLLICSPTMPGFSLVDKHWMEFAVAHIKEIAWKEAPLDDLHLPSKKKKAVQALSEAHVKRSSGNSFDDIVAGKGQGFNLLLHGPPGVGKTLTAEVLSEHLQTPLMQVSAGELGTTPMTVEFRLPPIFRRASRWKALLLMDEADVFLEQRSVQDINRNALVCVFLRTLEYYQGIMFLTTNRVRNIDDAIASRIHFKIKYDILNLEQRQGVWKYFLGKAITSQGEPVYSLTDFESLVRKEINGREIKSIVSTALALAIQDRASVTMSHLDFAIAAGGDFECDFKGRGSTEALNSYF